MPQSDWLILLVISGLLILLGLGGVIWGKVWQKSYYNSISQRKDMREFLEHLPERPEPGAIRVGGWLAIAIGLAMIVVGGVFRLWG